MRRIAMLIILVVLTGCAGPRVLEKQYAPGNILPLDRFLALKDPAAINSHATYLDTGDTIPLKLDVKNDLFGLVQKQVDLVAKQKIFFRVTLPEDMSEEKLSQLLSLTPERLSEMTPSEKQALFKDMMLSASKDGEHWAPLNDIRAMKEIFGIKGGELSLGLAMSETEGVWAVFSMKMNTGTNQ